MDYKKQSFELKLRHKYNRMGVVQLSKDLCNDCLEAAKSIDELLARAEAAEARCKILETRLETAEKMVKEYQDTIVPGYRERAEKAEAERDAAVSDMEALMCNCVDGRHVCANAIVVHREPCVRLDCELKGRKCNPKWRGAKEE